jgi:alkylated DNA repair dioxygenase AlkB
MSEYQLTIDSKLINYNLSDKSHELYEVYTLLNDSIKDLHLSLEPEIKIFNKVCKQHRAIGFYSNVAEEYKYNHGQSDKELKPISNHKLDDNKNLVKVIELINEHFKSEYNSILVNYYRDGNDYIGSHSDNEKELDSKMGVLMISLGSTRLFRIRDKKSKDVIKDINICNGDLTIMSGKFQKELKHEIVKESSIDKPRISFTFRKFVK